MRSKSHKQLKLLRAPRVATHFPSMRQEVDLNTNAYIFVRGVQLAVMPIGGKSSQAPDFSVEIQGSSENKDRAIELLQSLTGEDWYNGQSLEELLSDSVAKLARNLAWHGRAVHEIIRDEENGEVCLLHSFRPRRLFRAFGRYLQIIPKADRGLWGKCCVIIPKKDVWDIAMPKVLGGYRGYRAMLRKFTRFPNPDPLFLTKGLNGQGQPIHYDFQFHVRELELFETKITALWGWDRQDYSERNWTEFYGAYRSVTFKWAQACMREYIVKELNQLFQRLSIEAKIVMKGLPTTQRYWKFDNKCVKAIFR